MRIGDDRQRIGEQIVGLPRKDHRAGVRKRRPCYSQGGCRLSQKRYGKAALWATTTRLPIGSLSSAPQIGEPRLIGNVLSPYSVNARVHEIEVVEIFGWTHEVSVMGGQDLSVNDFGETDAAGRTTV